LSKVERLHELVVQHARRWAIANWPEEAVAALGLAYGAGNPPIPLVGLITVAEWDEWLAEPDPYGIGLSLWNPGEYGIVDALDVTDEAVMIADELMETWELDEDWFTFMGDVARALAVHDWSSLPKSPDFVVFANTSMDINEQHELDRQLAASIPPTLLDRFRARGLLDVAPPD
jgi:hypothetical protein